MDTRKVYDTLRYRLEDGGRISGVCNISCLGFIDSNRPLVVENVGKFAVW